MGPGGPGTLVVYPIRPKTPPYPYPFTPTPITLTLFFFLPGCNFIDLWKNKIGQIFELIEIKSLKAKTDLRVKAEGVGDDEQQPSGANQSKKQKQSQECVKTLQKDWARSWEQGAKKKTYQDHRPKDTKITVGFVPISKKQQAGKQKKA